MGCREAETSNCSGFVAPARLTGGSRQLSPQRLDLCLDLLAAGWPEVAHNEAGPEDLG